MTTFNPQVQAPPTTTETKTAWHKTIDGRNRFATIVTYALLIPIGFVFVFPFFVMLFTALKTPPEIFKFPPQLFPEIPQWQNFDEGWNGYLPFNTFLMNSIKITLNNVIGNLVSCCLAAYAFARLRARGKSFFFAIILATMVIPVEVLIIPQYILFTNLGWNNSHLPLMVPPWFGWPFFIFLLRQFFMSIPQELVDAALIDGAGHFRILTTIFIPLSKPALATVAIFAFIGNWNNFLSPLIYLQKEELLTLPVGLVQFQGAYGNTDWHLMMAVATIVVIPVLIIFAVGQRYFVQGIATSGLKG